MNLTTIICIKIFVILVFLLQMRDSYEHGKVDKWFGAKKKKLIIGAMSLGYEEAYHIDLNGNNDPYVKIWVSNVMVTQNIINTNNSVDGMPTEKIVKIKQCSWRVKNNEACIGGGGNQIARDESTIKDGFCCSCKQAGSFKNGSFHQRGHADCKSSSAFKSSLHCMVHSTLWYDVYEPTSNSMSVSYVVEFGVGQLVERFKINDTSKVLEHNYFRLSIGDFVMRENPKPLSNTWILVPKNKYQSDDEMTMMKNILVIPKDMVDLTGGTCGKVGVRRPAFDAFYKKNLIQTCGTTDQSCLSNQPYSLYQKDTSSNTQNEKRKFTLQNHVVLQDPNSEVAGKQLDHIIYSDREIIFYHHMLLEHRTVNIIKPTVRTHARFQNISDAKQNDDDDDDGSFQINLFVKNDGIFEGDFFVYIGQCSTEITNSSSNHIFIEAGQVEYVQLRLFHPLTRNGKFYCRVRIDAQNDINLEEITMLFDYVRPCDCLKHCDCKCALKYPSCQKYIKDTETESETEDTKLLSSFILSVLGASFIFILFVICALKPELAIKLLKTLFMKVLSRKKTSKSSTENIQNVVVAVDSNIDTTNNFQTSTHDDVIISIPDSLPKSKEDKLEQKHQNLEQLSPSESNNNKLNEEADPLSSRQPPMKPPRPVLLKH